MTIADAPAIAQLNPPRRILLGPGPSPVDDRVLRMMSAPLVGHLDPFFVRAMDEAQELLRYVFETNNRLTIPVSGTGSAGMEAAVVNLIEPDEEIVICVNGYFGERMHEMALRAGARPIRVECEWGGPVDLEKARKAWRGSNARVLFAAHAETSTGVFKGKVWRVGLMGAGSVENNVLLMLGALEKCLKDEGFKVKDSGVSAAAAFYAEN